MIVMIFDIYSEGYFQENSLVLFVKSPHPLLSHKIIETKLKVVLKCAFPLLQTVMFVKFIRNYADILRNDCLFA